MNQTTAWPKWFLALIMIATLVLGWHNPLWGWVVPGVMLLALGVGLFRGRYVCGNLCPRGAFWDSWFLPFRGGRAFPSVLRSASFRWTVLIGMFSFMFWRGLQNPTSIAHWGELFWWMCLVTTLVGIGLGMLYDARAWCAFCPIGTLGKVAGSEGEKRPLYLSTGCVACGQCNTVCPMQLSLPSGEKQGRVVQGDCIQCSQCVQQCPVHCLSWGPRV